MQASADETADEVNFEYSCSDDDVGTFEEEDRNPDGGEDIGGKDSHTTLLALWHLLLSLSFRTHCTH